MGEVSAEDSEDVDVAEAAVIVVVDAAVVVVVDSAKTRKNGFPSPNLDVSLKMAESRFGGNLSLLSPHQRIRNHRFLFGTLFERRSPQNHARSETDPCRSTYPL